MPIPKDNPSIVSIKEYNASVNIKCDKATKDAIAHAAVMPINTSATEDKTIFLSFSPFIHLF